MSGTAGQTQYEFRLKRIFLVLCVCFLAFVGIFYWIVGEQWNNQPVKTETVSPAGNLGELNGNVVIEQPFAVFSKTLDKLSLYAGTFGRVNNSGFQLEILQDQTVLLSQAVQTDAFVNEKFNSVLLEHSLLDAAGKVYTLRITMKDVPAGQGITLWHGTKVSAGRFSVDAPELHGFLVNGVPYEGSLCMTLGGRNTTQIEGWYFGIAAGLLLSMIAGYFVLRNRQKRGIRSFLMTCADVLVQYRFLIKQLVIRDFKVKYKRSILGVLWSFLNPLLTMGVQFFVFSTIFKTDVENFLVYLLSGIVMFSFFSESVGLGMASIVTNSALIKKVYMPKYIYPVTRILSSAINLLISLIPLLLMTVITGLPWTKALLLLPIPIFFMIVFCVGMSFLLSTSMVFFRDTQFLWGILSSLWMYFTPIFYPESIIPPPFLPLFRSNPLYQFIYFLRSITLDGVSPPPANYLYCALCAVIPLLIGILVFKKKQDRFILYL